LKTKAAAACIAAVFIASGGGAGKVAKATNDELKQVILSLADDLDAKDERIDVMSAQIQAFQKSQASENKVSVRQIGDGTSRTQFVTGTDESAEGAGKITFPKAFEIEGLTKSPNTTRIIIGDNVSLSTSENWLVTLGAGTVNLSHTEGIEGVLRIARTSEPLKTAKYDEALKEFFAPFPTAEIVYSDVFVGDSSRGRMAEASYILDEKPVEILVVGVGNSGSVIVGAFQYETGGIRRELAFNLLKTLKFGENPVRVEN
jgi:hypothetical protein